MKYIVRKITKMLAQKHSRSKFLDISRLSSTPSNNILYKIIIASRLCSKHW